MKKLIFYFGFTLFFLNCSDQKTAPKIKEGSNFEKIILEADSIARGVSKKANIYYELKKFYYNEGKFIVYDSSKDYGYDAKYLTVLINKANKEWKRYSEFETGEDSSYDIVYYFVDGKVMEIETIEKILDASCKGDATKDVMRKRVWEINGSTKTLVSNKITDIHSNEIPESECVLQSNIFTEKNDFYKNVNDIPLFKFLKN